MQFHERLKELRTSHNMTQKDVYTAVGLSMLGYQRYEYGERTPTLPTLIALADLFQVSLDYLVGRSAEPERR